MLVLQCGEGLDRALPAHVRIGLSKDTIGGEIVDRDGITKPQFDASRSVLFIGPGRSRSAALPATYPPALNSSQAGASVSGTSAMIRGGPRIASFEPSESSR